MKLLASAIALAPPRGGDYRISLPALRTQLTWRLFGEVLGRVVIIMLFSSMALRIAADVHATGHVTGLLLVVSETLVVVLTLVRRRAGTIDRSWRARILTLCSTFGPLMLRPVSAGALLPELTTIVIGVAGITVVVCGKMSLGRSFGLAPANRGIVSTGMYRFARHPIYFGYLVTHVAFLLANPSLGNAALLAVADIALMFRAVCEEETLAKDGAYREYMQRVRWRILPRVF
jgi:protein-S-isoprenylcysteine O-methyltransferase Ste14